MDPITHALVGANIAGLSGHGMSLSDPLFLGPTLASMAPDLDIIMQFKGDLAYLKNHRGFSHSLPGVVMIGSATALMLHFLLGGRAPLASLMLLSIAGALSHSFMDILNSYGVKLLWPLINKKITFSLLGLVDWVVMGVSLLGVIGTVYYSYFPVVWACAITTYFACRFFIAHKVRRYLQLSFSGEGALKQVVLLPSPFSIIKWGFLVETTGSFIVGEVLAFSLATKIRQTLQKTKENAFIQAALNSKLGSLFKDFTPHFHVIHVRGSSRHRVHFMDLRYFSEEDFMHSGMVALDEDCCTLEEFFQPYSRDRKIRLS